MENRAIFRILKYPFCQKKIATAITNKAVAVKLIVIKVKATYKIASPTLSILFFTK